MKFINYLTNISGIGVYPLVSFLIFFLFFLIITIYLIKAGKTYFDEVSQIPLDTNKNELNNETR